MGGRWAASGSNLNIRDGKFFPRIGILPNHRAGN
jgi:hypothetical protein